VDYEEGSEAWLMHQSLQLPKLALRNRAVELGQDKALLDGLEKVCNSNWRKPLLDSAAGVIRDREA